MLPEIPPFLVKHYLELYNHIISLGKRFLIRCNTWKWWGDTADEAGRVLPSPGIAVMSRAALLKVLGEVHSISWKKGFLAKFIWETLVFKSSWWSLFSAGLVRNFKCTVWISLLYSISQTYLTNKPFSPPQSGRAIVQWIKFGKLIQNVERSLNLFCHSQLGKC